MRFLLILALMFASNINANNINIKRLLDNGEPLNITLPINQEIMLKFENVIESIGIKDDVNNKLLSESIDSRWWIKANAKINEPTKILVKDIKGRIMVFIVSVSKQNNPVTNYQIITQQVTQPVVVQQPKDQQLSLVDLTRFAAQNLYAPKRLIRGIGVSRVPVNINQSINLFSCNTVTICLSVVAKPIIAWTDNNYYISAIEIKNISNQIIDLDPRDLIGNFVSATFHFNRLGVANSNTDTTVLYIITEQSL